VLEALLDQGATVLVTTHLEELKALAHLDPRFVNARVGFDSKRMAPTYRLQLGFAGASSAIEIARRVGLPEAVCQRATALATNTGGALSKALAAAETERRTMYEQRDAAERETRAAQQLKAALELELAAAQRTRKEEELKFREALRAELEFARGHVRALVEKLGTDRSDKALKAAQASATELSERANEQALAAQALRSELKGEVLELAPLELKPGARARHRTLNAEVEILEVAGDFATVAMGALRSRVKLAELMPTTKPRGAFARPLAARRKRPSWRTRRGPSAQPMTLASPSLDVRGQRAEDALRQVEQFLDRLTRAGEEAALIVHGHGTGALKRELREYLAHSPYVKSSRPGDATEGGDGVTVALL
jgi:DNA mismatch repair protein MutS2